MDAVLYREMNRRNQLLQEGRKRHVRRIDPNILEAQFVDLYIPTPDQDIEEGQQIRFLASRLSRAER